MTSATADSKISLKYGIWFSTMCIKIHNDEHSSETDDDDDRGMIQDDATGDEQRKHHRKCHCQKMPPTCFFEMYDTFASPMESDANLRNDRKGLGRKLTEHRVEGTISVVTCLVGLIFGAIAYKTGNGRKLFAVVGLVSMFVSCILIALPLYRIGSYNVHMHHNALIAVRPPFSVLCSAIGWLLGLITALVIAAGLFRKKPNGGWYRFSNDAETQSMKEKPGLVLDVEPLPLKPDIDVAYPNGAKLIQ